MKYILIIFYLVNYIIYIYICNFVGAIFCLIFQYPGLHTRAGSGIAIR